MSGLQLATNRVPLGVPWAAVVKLPLYSTCKGLSLSSVSPVVAVPLGIYVAGTLGVLAVVMMGSFSDAPIINILVNKA